LCGGFAELVALGYKAGWPLSQPAVGNVIPSIVLGLLLVFRTNTAYDRFWEGRKAWGTLLNTVRNLARQIWVTLPGHDRLAHAEKVAVLKLLVAFAVATKLRLRDEPLDSDLEMLVSPEQFKQLQTISNAPLEIAVWIADFLQRQHQDDRLTNYQLTAMHRLLDQLVDMLGACERILKTPMPLAYAIHLKQLLLLYCLMLPFQLVHELSISTGLIVTLVSFTLFGIEEIGLEIENPFGRDPNDLPLDTICQTMLHNIEDLIRSGTVNHSS